MELQNGREECCLVFGTVTVVCSHTLSGSEKHVFQNKTFIFITGNWKLDERKNIEILCIIFLFNLEPSKVLMQSTRGPP